MFHITRSNTAALSIVYAQSGIPILSPGDVYSDAKGHTYLVIGDTSIVAGTMYISRKLINLQTFEEEIDGIKKVIDKTLVKVEGCKLHIEGVRKQNVG